MVSENDRNLYRTCRICPRGCGIDRFEGKTGVCGMGSTPVVNISMHHYGEEPSISGDTSSGGSGAVFFEGCPLKCLFCQNYAISRGTTRRGEKYDWNKLSDLFLKLQEEGVNNINLVTALHFAPDIALSLEKARNHGLSIPVIVNSGGYESVETLKLLDGLVDVYLPDMKVWSDKLAKELFNAPNYREIACKTLDEMYRQTGPVVINDSGFIQKGMIVRHLMLPSQLFDTKKVLDYLTSTFGNNIYISLMSQYTQMPHLDKINCPEYLRKSLKPSHYNSAVDYLIELNQYNAYVQGDESVGDSMIPDFK